MLIGEELYVSMLSVTIGSNSLWRTGVHGGGQVRAPENENFFFKLPKFEKKFGKFM